MNMTADQVLEQNRTVARQMAFQTAQQRAKPDASIQDIIASAQIILEFLQPSGAPAPDYAPKPVSATAEPAMPDAEFVAGHDDAA